MMQDSPRSSPSPSGAGAGAGDRAGAAYRRGRSDSLAVLGGFASLDDFVKAMGGDRVIRKVLVANNGIAAVKCIRFMRKWTYEMFGNEKEISFAVMVTPEDLKANAEYIRMADEVIDVPGGSNNHNYANVKLIVQTAENCRADAVWAGWGHASENPTLPRSLAAKDIVFIGPGGGPMHALGDKIGATIIAQSAGVPTIPWNGADLRFDYKKDGEVTEALINKANVLTVEDAEAAATRIGFPLMIKASEGGGGKGIRRVTELEGVRDAFHQVQSELPGSPVFLMRMATQCRHLEVQLLCDKYGGAIALSGRDCSVQRRHQKIIEEGPPVAPPPALWVEMERAAIRLAQAVDYCNAGTVEYLYMEEEERFAFLELNPRLQVEHPVTEMITGVNLPAAQLQVAMGLPLHRIPDIRRLYGLDPLEDSVIDFENVDQVRTKGHVIAARITAENAESGFTPTSGAVSELNFRSTPNVWGYFSVDSSGRVHEFADSQIGHLFAWGKSREAARRNVVLALKELSIRGDIRTTTEYLVDLMESTDFRDNIITTAWLDSRIQRKVTSTSKPNQLLVAVIGAAVIGDATIETRVQDFKSALLRGQLPPASFLSVTEPLELIYSGVKYGLTVSRSSDTTVRITCNGNSLNANVSRLRDGGRLVRIADRSHVAYTINEPSGIRLVLDGNTCLFTNEYDPTRLCASMSGKLVRFLVEDGAHVRSGQTYAEVEVMKMYMTLQVPESGFIQLVKLEGSVLEPGELIATVTLDDPSTVHRAENFSGSIATLAPPTPYSRWVGPPGSTHPHKVAFHATQLLQDALDGYDVPNDQVEQALRDRDIAMRDPLVPLLELEDVMSFLSDKLPFKLSGSISDLLSAHRKFVEDALDAESALIPPPEPAASPSADAGTSKGSVSFLGPLELNVQAIGAVVEEAIAALPPRDQAALTDLCAPIMEIVSKYTYGIIGANRASLTELLERFWDVELLFGGGQQERRPEDVLFELRQADGSTESLTRLYNIARAHSRLGPRCQLVVSVIRRLASALEAAKHVIQQATEKQPSPPGSVNTGSASAGISGAFGRSSSRGALSAPLFSGGSASSVASSEKEDVSVDADSPDAVPVVIHKLAELSGVQFAEVTLEARQMLIVQQGPSFEQKMKAIETMLMHDPTASDGSPSETFTGTSNFIAPASDSTTVFTDLRGDLPTTSEEPATTSDSAKSGIIDHLSELVDQEEGLVDLMLPFFARSDPVVARNAVAVYVRRLYRAYDIRWLRVIGTLVGPDGFILHHPPSRAMSPTSQARAVADLQVKTPGSQELPNPPYLLARWDFSGMPPSDPMEGENTAYTDKFRRHGIMGVFQHLGHLSQHIDGFLAALTRPLGDTPCDSPTPPASDTPDEVVKPVSVHVLHIALLESPILQTHRRATPLSPSRDGGAPEFRVEIDDDSEAAVISMFEDFLKPFHPLLREMAVRRITFQVPNLKQLSVYAEPSIPSSRLVASSSPKATPTPLTLGPPATTSAATGSAAGTLSGAHDGSFASIGGPSSRSSVDTSDLDASGSRRLFRGRASTASTQDGGVGGYGGVPQSAEACQPSIYTLRSRLQFKEDSIVRHIEPTHAGQLELKRLSKFDIRMVPVPNPAVHVYEAVPHETDPETVLFDGKRSVGRKRFFVRAIGRQIERIQSIGNVLDQFPGPERMFVEALNSLNIAMGDALKDITLPVGNNHIFLNVLPPVEVNHDYIEAVIKTLAKRYADRLRRLRVSQVEFRLIAITRGMRVPVRLVSTNPTGYVLRVDSYVETIDAATKVPTFKSIAIPSSRYSLSRGDAVSSLSRAGELDGRSTLTPYPVATHFELRRALAATLSDTLFAYDFLELFQRAIGQEWAAASADAGIRRRPRVLMKAVELVLATEPEPTVPLPDLPSLRRNVSEFFSNELGGGDSPALGPKKSPSRPTAVGGAPGASRQRPLGDRGVSVGSSPPPQASAAAGSSEPRLVERIRPPGQNTIGMIAWRITMYTPQYPEAAGGRDIVVIANDITHQGGSFGVQEDCLFKLASEYARENGLPRIYLAANCGARIGLAEEVKRAFRVAWTDDRDPTKGYEYLYLSPEDNAKLTARGSVNTVRIEENGEVRHRIVDIIGAVEGLGVENLRGSGAIAGETARANAESFTLTYVTGRSVGIGAYLVRLGQRTIQKATSAPILLTGYRALNKLVGQDVYSSNMQLGGPKIMHTNGVSHMTVENDLQGISAIVKWLAFVPRVAGGDPPAFKTSDAVDRDVIVVPDKQSDPRQFLTGMLVADSKTSMSSAANVSGVSAAGSPSIPPTAGAGAGAGSGIAGAGGAGASAGSGASSTGGAEDSTIPPIAPRKPLGMSGESSRARKQKWLAGFFDRNSFIEALDGWARTVIVGRARLGGIPMGVIVPETQAVVARTPADPAFPETQETSVTQAGGVWYPDSAFKTAQAIRDFNAEGLPLMIFANWRGFSGGQRDMFDQVLKFGSYIVEALVSYKQPVFVYIPPGCELRGGAWVVVDPSINPEMMEMYADSTARGGVLEPAGTAEIKFRKKDLSAAAMRLDPVIKSLKASLESGSVSPTETEDLKRRIRAREAQLAPLYLKVAHSFADLHDTPGRMLAKKCISSIVPWRQARRFFFVRLRRRLVEMSFCKRMITAAESLTMTQAHELLHRWFQDSIRPEACVWSDDRQVLTWMAQHREQLAGNINRLRRDLITQQVLQHGLADPSAVVEGVLAMINHLSVDQRDAVVTSLRRGVIFADPFAAAQQDERPGWSGSYADDEEEWYQEPYSYIQTGPPATAAPPGAKRVPPPSVHGHHGGSSFGVSTSFTSAAGLMGDPTGAGESSSIGYSFSARQSSTGSPARSSSGSGMWF